MVIECDVINYDLMSEVEKTAVESGFVQFLNTLRNQIQLYVQTKTINISSSVKNYNVRLDALKKELEQKEMKYERLKQLENRDRKEEQELAFEIKRLKNLYEYGVDVVCIAKDLSNPSSAKEVYDETGNLGLRIDYLVNNAGFGDYGPQEGDGESSIGSAAQWKETALYMDGVIQEELTAV